MRRVGRSVGVVSGWAVKVRVVGAGGPPWAGVGGGACTVDGRGEDFRGFVDVGLGLGGRRTTSVVEDGWQT